MSLKKKALICCLTAAMSTGVLTAPVANAAPFSQGSSSSSYPFWKCLPFEHCPYDDVPPQFWQFS